MLCLTPFLPYPVPLDWVLSLLASPCCSFVSSSVRSQHQHRFKVAHILSFLSPHAPAKQTTTARGSNNNNTNSTNSSSLRESPSRSRPIEAAINRSI
jgi:hypothetical protein